MENKKKYKKIQIIFDGESVLSLNIDPKENEFPRVDYKGIFGLNDPLASFLNILVSDDSRHNTIDGRRIYKMSLDFKNENENSVTKKIIIKDYTNIWADHKRNDLKYIIIEMGPISNENILPNKIKIKNKGLVFKLTRV